MSSSSMLDRTTGFTWSLGASGRLPLRPAGASAAVTGPFFASRLALMPRRNRFDSMVPCGHAFLGMILGKAGGRRPCGMAGWLCFCGAPPSRENKKLPIRSPSDRLRKTFALSEGASSGDRRVVEVPDRVQPGPKRAGGLNPIHFACRELGAIASNFSVQMCVLKGSCQFVWRNQRD